MTHWTQFCDAYIRKGAEANAVTMAEYRECVDQQAMLEDWMTETSRFLRTGGMSRAWWNMVMKQPGTYGMVARWMHDNPDAARQWGHDMEWALAHVRRDAKARKPQAASLARAAGGSKPCE